MATIYMIRHGEKISDDVEGLSARGLERAQALRKVFGAASEYDIKYILAEQPKSHGKRTRPLDTVAPLAKDLGLDVDTSCDRDDYDAVAQAVKAYTGPGNILICWEHGALQGIAQAIGVSDAPAYDGTHFDLIWTIPPPYDKITSITSEGTELDQGGTS